MATEVKVERAPLAPRIDGVRADVPAVGASPEAAAFRQNCRRLDVKLEPRLLFAMSYCCAHTFQDSKVRHVQPEVIAVFLLNSVPSFSLCSRRSNAGDYGSGGMCKEDSMGW